MEIIDWILRIVAFVSSSLAIFTKWDKKIRISLFVFSLIIAVTLASVAFFTALNPTYYDKYGNEYDSLNDVVYYTEDDKKYILDRETYYFIEVDNPENKIKEDDVFLDKNGYLVTIPRENIEVDQHTDDNDPYGFYDSNGNRYAAPFVCSWDSEGNLCLR